MRGGAAARRRGSDLVVEVLDVQLRDVETLEKIHRHVVLSSPSCIRANVENHFARGVGDDGLVNLGVVFGLIARSAIRSSIGWCVDVPGPGAVSVSSYSCHNWITIPPDRVILGGLPAPQCDARRCFRSWSSQCRAGSLNPGSKRCLRRISLALVQACRCLMTRRAGSGRRSCRDGRRSRIEYPIAIFQCESTRSRG